MEVFRLSAKSGEGIDDFLKHLAIRLTESRSTSLA